VPAAVIQYEHRSVLLTEAVNALDIVGPRKSGCYIDGTFGRGGHSRAILEQLDASGRLVAFDKDKSAIAVAEAIDDARFSIVHDSFATLGQGLKQLGVSGVAGVLLDLGISSPQVDDATRGFSFRNDGPLDMRMDQTRGQTVEQWLASAELEEIREVIRDYGEERFALQIAKALVARREQRPLSGTRELATLVADVVRTREKGQDPATRTFQAFRIFINQELAELEQGLEAAMEVLLPGGRMVVISFHSLEDRIVKRFMARAAHPEQPDRRLPIRAADLPVGSVQLLGRVKPSEAEVKANPRARSAVMRVMQKNLTGHAHDAP
jgi:16S rRNA (cytosine1402-N4)-methyltransferase